MHDLLCMFKNQRVRIPTNGIPQMFTLHTTIKSVPAITNTERILKKTRHIPAQATLVAGRALYCEYMVRLILYNTRKDR